MTANNMAPYTTALNDEPVLSKKPRRKPMLWEELGGKKEPEFRRLYGLREG